MPGTLAPSVEDGCVQAVPSAVRPGSRASRLGLADDVTGVRA
jgi:hypothetical protein